MSVTLPTIGTISYATDAGTYTFGVMTETVSIDGREVYDPSDRVVTAMAWTLTVRTVVPATPPTTTDAAVEAIRHILTRPGGDLSYSDKGFGPLSINTGLVRDVAYGPKPRRFQWKPLASRHAVEVVWTVEVTIPECANAAFTGISQASFRVSYDIDRAGMTRRTFMGHLRIANRWNGNRPADCADQYRDQFVPALPLMFQRVSQRFETSEDKSQLDITVTDEELTSPNAYPPGIVKIDHFAHDYRNLAGRMFAIQSGSMSATYHVARGWPLSIAVAHFKKCVKDRVFTLAAQAKFKGQKLFKNDELIKLPPGEILCTPLPVASSIREEPYDQKVFCQFEWTVATSPTYLFAGAMFRPMPDSNGQLWARSLGDITGPRGWAGLELSRTDDAYVSLCDNQSPTVLKNKNLPVPVPPPGPVRDLLDDWPKPTPDTSWVSLQTRWTLEGEDHVLRHVPLESSTSRLRTPALAGYDPLKDFAAVPKGKEKTVIQKSAATMPFLIFEGVCVRATFDIPVPRVLGAFGRKAVPANREGVEYVEMFELPLISPIALRVLRWRQRYMLVDADTDLPDGIDARVPPQGPNIPPSSEIPARPQIAVMKTGR